MKTLKTAIFTIAMLTLSFGATSCKKDKEDPTITVGSPAEHALFKWGEEVHVMATFDDDRGLKNYTVMVCDADGNLNHEIDFMKSGETSELSYDFHDHFVVPNDSPMMAYIHFTVVDAEDKTTTKMWMIHFEE